MTCRHQEAGNLKKRSYFFFLATLRVFFAVFFTALFAFFAFFAFLAMLPSVIPGWLNASRVPTCMKRRVHHNLRLDTAGFEEGKRPLRFASEDVS
mgnify:CR=1 FL=1